MANYSTGMLANLNGQQNYFEPILAEAEEQPASQEAPAEETAGSGMFPPPDPTGASVLQKTLLPFDDHPFAQVSRAPWLERTASHCLVVVEATRWALAPALRPHLQLSPPCLRVAVVAHESTATTRRHGAGAGAPSNSRTSRSRWRFSADIIARPESHAAWIL